MKKYQEVIVKKTYPRIHQQPMRSETKVLAKGKNNNGIDTAQSRIIANNTVPQGKHGRRIVVENKKWQDKYGRRKVNYDGKIGTTGARMKVQSLCELGLDSRVSIHHLNGDCKDDRLENLSIVSTHMHSNNNLERIACKGLYKWMIPLAEYSWLEENIEETPNGIRVNCDFEQIPKEEIEQVANSAKTFCRGCKGCILNAFNK
jgi:hypothetical protein